MPSILSTDDMCFRLSQLYAVLQSNNMLCPTSAMQLIALPFSLLSSCFRCNDNVPHCVIRMAKHCCCKDNVTAGSVHIVCTATKLETSVMCWINHKHCCNTTMRCSSKTHGESIHLTAAPSSNTLRTLVQTTATARQLLYGCAH
jgi:hypothetical protein